MRLRSLHFLPRFNLVASGRYLHFTESFFSRRARVSRPRVEFTKLSQNCNDFFFLYIPFVHLANICKSPVAVAQMNTAYASLLSLPPYFSISESASNKRMPLDGGRVLCCVAEQLALTTQPNNALMQNIICPTKL